MQFTLAALIAATLAGLTSAYTQPVGAQPSGNPTSHPALAEQVPVGTPFEVTWTPTTKGTVTILLLNGPSENIQVLYPIVEKLPNTGKFAWTPKTDLKGDVTHYGLQIIDDATGQYQYTPQFGIKNNSPVVSASTSVSSSGYASVSPVVSSSAPATTSVTKTAVVTLPTTSVVVVTMTTATVPSSSAYIPSGWSNSTTVATGSSPTGTSTVTTSSVLTLPTGAAERVVANAAAAFAGLGALAMLAL